MDLARLGLEVDSRPVERARDALGRFVSAAKQAELAAGGLAKGVEAGSAAMGRQVDNAVNAANRLMGANDNIAKSGRLARHELINLSRQIQDVGVSLASGQSPFIVLVQQGTQIADVFASSEATLRGFGSQVASVFTPARVGIVGLSAAVLAGAVAWAQYDSTQREAARALTGMGRDAGLTVAKINEAANAAARLQGISIGQTRDTVGALANTGRINATMLVPITALQRNLAATLGVDGVEANKLLAASFSDPVRGAELLNDRVGGLTERTRQYVAELMASGKEQRAQQVLIDTFGPRLGRAAELTSVWARAWEAVKAKSAEAGEAVGRAIEKGLAAGTGKTFLREAEERLAALDAQAQGMVVDRTNGRVLGNRSAFGITQEELQREEGGRKRVSAELELQRAAIHAIRMGQESVNLAVERQAGLEAEIARNRRLVDRGTEAARDLGLPERRQIDDLTTLINKYRDLVGARDAAYQNQGAEGGFETYRRAQRDLLEGQRALRSALLDNGRGVIGRDGALLLENNQILDRRLTLTDQLNQRTQVDRQQMTAVTAAQQAAAAAAREHQQAREQGASAGNAELVAARALAAAETVRVGINHQLLQAARERIRSTELQIGAVRAETAAMGGSIGLQEKVRLETQLLNDARREYARLGLQMPQAEIDHYKRLAEAMGQARQQQAEMRMLRDLGFDRQTMFMSDSERGIATQLRSIYGDAWSQQMNGAIASQMRFNEQLRLTNDLAMDFGRTFANDVMNGKSATEALGNAVKNLSARLIQMAMDQAIKQLLGGLMGSFGGFGGLFGGGAISPFGLYANGGAFSGGIQTFALGGTFTNSIVSKPTLFPFANGTGLMGEAGPEAIMPLRRGPDGRLGVSAPGGGGNVVRMGDTHITIQGNADRNTIAMMKAELDRRDAQLKAEMPGVMAKARRDGIAA
jgi:phage-related minor tail protein